MVLFKYFPSNYFMPSPILTAFFELTYLFHITVMGGQHVYFYFMDEVTDGRDAKYFV